MGIRRLRAYPLSVRPLAVWGWGQGISPEQVEPALERLVRLGFGGVVVAPRGTGAMAAFLSTAWIEALEAAEQAVRKANLEMWAEAPLRGFGRNGPLPLSDLGRQISLASPPLESCPPHSILAYYRRDANGRVRRLRGGDPKKLRSSAHLALSVVRGDGPDCLEPAVAARYATFVLGAHRAVFPKKNPKTAFRGFFLGAPGALRGEMFNEHLAGDLEEAGFADFFGRAPDLFGETTGGEPAFVHQYRLAVGRAMQRLFAQPLMEWSREHQVAVVAPVDSPWDGAFPAWAFHGAGMRRRIEAPLLDQNCGTERLVADEGEGGLPPFVHIANAAEEGGRAGASCLCCAADRVMACTGGRAIVDWLPLSDSIPLEWAHGGASMALALPSLRGLREMNMRLASWSIIGSAARRKPRILLVAPQTSYWRLPRPVSALNGGKRPSSAPEFERLHTLMARVENCLRAMSFDYAVWHECSAAPAGLGVVPQRDERFDLVILPGLLNLQESSWTALADYAAAGGKIAALERYPAFLDGMASDDLTNWARSAVERCETIDHLTACLEDHIERPVRAISLTRGMEPRAPEVLGLEEGGHCTWVVARNADGSSPVRGLIETTSEADEFLDEVDLETGNLTAAPSAVRLDDVLSLEVELAPGQTRVFKLQKAPLAEVESFLAEAPPQYAQIVVGTDWKVLPADENLFPLSWMEFALPGLPWLGPEHASQLPEAILRQLGLTGAAQSGHVQLKFLFDIEQGPSVALAELLDLGLYCHPRTQLLQAELNGVGARVDAAADHPRTGLRRLALPHSARLGMNELVVRVGLKAKDLEAGVIAPWILGGRFGVMPSHQFNAGEHETLHAPGGYRLLACPGSSERLTDHVSWESNLIDGIQEFVAGSDSVARTRAWIDWPSWPLLRQCRGMHEIGMPFYGGMVKIEGEVTLPSPGRAVGPWKTAVFSTGPVQAAWAALKVNGFAAGSLALPPFRRDITGLLDASGRNHISLRLWFSWSQALSPFRSETRNSPPELYIARRGFLNPPRIVLYG